MKQTSDSRPYDYRASSRRKYSLIAIGAAVCIAVFILDVVFSARYINPIDVFMTVFDPAGSTKIMRVVVWDIKIPSALMGIVVGLGFGISGAVMQTILNNPLASPYTLGISAGAGFGAAFAMVIGVGGLAIIGSYLIPLFAFVFAMGACAGIFIIAKLKRFTAETMVLAGIGLVFLFQALQTLMQYLASPEALQGIVFWTYGSLAGANWKNLAIVFTVFVVCFAFIYRKCWTLTAMKLGDSKASALGIDVNKTRRNMFVIISLLTAVSVAFVGCIGFIGIIGPHIARMILGEDQRFFLPMSGLCGAAVLVSADAAARLIGGDVMLPIGVLTSAIGVPFFFYLLAKRRSVRS